MADNSSRGSAKDLAFLVDAFFTYLKRRQRAESTVERWRPELRRFVEWAGERTLAEITPQELEFSFLATWEADFVTRNGRDPSPNSVRAVMQAVGSFYRFLEKFDLLVTGEGSRLRNPALVLEAPTIRPAAELDWLKRDEDEALLGVKMNTRERTLVFLLRMTGLRVGEAISLLNRDVDLAENTIRVRSSKSDAGYRTVPIAPELRPQLQKWIAYTKAEALYQADGPFLVTRNKTAMKAQYVEDALERIGERAGLVRKLKPHTLRRTFGSHLLNKGARLEVVSRLLGHASTSVTEKAYARLEDSTIRDEMLQALRA
jgi:site-specific recombinase XerD